jgi:hypothetical protein
MSEDCVNQKCTWPHCRCDPVADRVVARLLDEGWKPPLEGPLPKNVHEYLVQRYGHHYTEVLPNEIISMANDLFEQFGRPTAKVAIAITQDRATPKPTAQEGGES